MNNIDKAIKEKKGIEIKISKELNELLKEFDSQNIFYGIFPITGNSMTCSNEAISIPAGSSVLANEIKIDFDNLASIPLKKPLLIEIKGIMMPRQFVCKTITHIDDTSKCLLFTSYNPDYKARYIPYCEIGRVYKIQEVFRNNEIDTIISF